MGRHIATARSPRLSRAAPSSDSACRCRAKKPSRASVIRLAAYSPVNVCFAPKNAAMIISGAITRRDMLRMLGIWFMGLRLQGFQSYRFA